MTLILPRFPHPTGETGLETSAFHFEFGSGGRIIAGTMHELAVTESILDIVCRHAERAHAERILSINLVIGELSSIVDDSVQFYFDYLSQDTVASGADLVFERLVTTLRCGACGYQWQPSSADWTCPGCGAAKAQVVAGREFYVDSIEVE